MSRRLPPLNALRAFESAARHLSLTKAADELHVTPAAIGHQVKALEDHLGVRLFRRLNRGLLLTDAGQACLPGLREGFDRLAAAVEQARVQRARRVLTVSVAPSFGAKWLVTRLDRFRVAHPHIDIRIDSSTRLVDFAREDIDLGICLGSGHYPGLRVDRLFSDDVFPVCSPRLAAGPRPLREPADLRFHTLLHVDFMLADFSWPDWSDWLRRAGIADLDVSRGPRFNQVSLAVQAAIEGHGVALGSRALVTDDLAAGRLVRPFDLSVPVNLAYYLVGPPATSAQASVAAFRAWLLEEAERHEAGARKP